MFPYSALEDFDILQKCKSGTVNILGNDSYTNTNLLNISQCKFPIKISKKPAVHELVRVFEEVFERKRRTV